MDTQIASTSRGYLHAVSSVQSDADAERFQTTMQRQGYQVARLTPAESAARFARPVGLPLSQSVEIPAPAQVIGDPEFGESSDVFKISDSFDMLPAPVQPFDTLPRPGRTVRYRWQDQPLTGTVIAVLRFPADHPHCPGRVALHVRSPGLESCLDVGAFEVVEAEVAAPEVPPISLPPRAPADWIQPGLW